MRLRNWVRKHIVWRAILYLSRIARVIGWDMSSQRFHYSTERIDIPMPECIYPATLDVYLEVFRRKPTMRIIHQQICLTITPDNPIHNGCSPISSFSYVGMFRRRDKDKIVARVMRDAIGHRVSHVQHP